MVAKVDEKTKTILMNMLDSVAAYSSELKVKREVRLWKTVEIPCSLYDAIYGLNKTEMDIIRKNYDFKNLSALKKADLAKALARLIPVNFKHILYRLDQNRYNLIRMIINHSGVLPDIGINVKNMEALRDFSVIFPGINNQQKILFIPNELSAVFSQLDGRELKCIVKRNTQWVCLAHGMLHYYGVMGIRTLMEKIGNLMNQKIDMLEFIHVMSFACDFYGQLSFTSAGYHDRKVSNVKHIIQEQKMRSGLDDYPFSKKQLMEASDPDFIDKTPEMNQFIRFLQEYYELSSTDLNEMILQITRMINEETELIQIIKYLESRLAFPSFEFTEELAKKITAVHNSTRQWVLKGNTPNEVFSEERKYLRPLPKEPFKSSQVDSTISKPPVSNNKVGRNDPCPCGSGQKFKKCCGK